MTGGRESVSAFSGARRAVPAVAGLTTRQLVRNGSLGVILLLFLVYLGFFATPSGLSDRAATARFLDDAFGGLVVALLMTGVFVALGRASGTTTVPAEIALGERPVGPAAWYWGRVLGTTGFLVALSALMVTVVLLHYAARFGDARGELFALERRILPTSADDSPVVLRAVGDEVAAEFEVGADASAVRDESTKDSMVVAFSPRLIVAQEGVAIRSMYPVRVRFEDVDGDWRSRRIVRLAQGKGKRFRVTLPKRAPSRIRVIVEKSDPAYFVKVRPGDLALVGPSASFHAGLLRGALVTALYAAVLAAVALFLATWFGFGVSLLGAAGVAVLMTSLEVFELGVLADVPETLKLVVLSGLRTVLPDFADYDVTELLTSGVTVGWRPVLDLAFRLVVTALVLGLVCGFARGGRRR